MSKIYKIGVVGVGRIGKVHIDTICKRIENSEVKSAADTMMNAEMEEYLSGYGIHHTYTDYQRLLEDDEIDAVVICSSTATHADIIYDCALAGKHVFCEKPIDLNVEKIRRVLTVVEQSGVKLQVGFHRRFDRHHKRIYDGVRNGEIGEPHVIKITSRDPAPPPIDYIRQSGGIYVDCMIHDFDIARYMSGSEAVEVFALGSCLIDPAIGEAGDVDTAAVVLKFESGAVALIDNSRKAVYGHDQRIEVFGSKGCLLDINDTPANTALMNSCGIIMEKPHYFFLERYYEAFVAEMKAFLLAIEGKEEIMCSGIDGLNSVLIAEAATQSWKTGKPVKIRY